MKILFGRYLSTKPSQHVLQNLLSLTSSCAVLLAHVSLPVSDLFLKVLFLPGNTEHCLLAFSFCDSFSYCCDFLKKISATGIPYITAN